MNIGNSNEQESLNSVLAAELKKHRFQNQEESEVDAKNPEIYVNFPINFSFRL